MAANPQTLFVIAAGNNSADNDDTSPGNVANRSYPCINSPLPGAVDNVICVAATNQRDRLASFSNWGATTVDLGAPGTDILSTYVTFPTDPFGDDFTTNDFSSRWTNTPTNAFTRTSEAPLTSPGIANSPAGDAQPLGTTRTTTSNPFTMPAGSQAGDCTLSFRGALAMDAGHTFDLGIVEGSTFHAARATGPLTYTGDVEFDFGTFAAGASLKIQFVYTVPSSGSSPSAAGDGAHIDDVVFNCIAPVDQPTGYAYLDGTSMATPMVSGAAALLFSQVPSASVTQVRNAILQNTDPNPFLANRTVTGGRLNVGKAMDGLIAATTPAPAARRHPPRRRHRLPRPLLQLQQQQQRCSRSRSPRPSAASCPSSAATRSPARRRCSSARIAGSAK